jgi:transposase
MRAVVNGVMYILSSGCQWRYLPKDFPPRSHNYFVWWQGDGVLDRIHHALCVECRERAPKRGASIDPPGYDAGKKIKGKKRHILVDTMGLLLHAIVHSVGIRDRDGGIFLLATLLGQFPFLEKLFTDSAYQGSIFGRALAKILPNLETEIVNDPIKPRGSCSCPSVGSSTHDCLAQSLPPPRQGLR